MERLRPFLITIGIVLGVGYLKMFLNFYFEFTSPMLLFFGAIAISSMYGGALHGALATLLSLFFIYTNFSVNSPNYFQLGLYAVDGLIVTLICSRIRSSKIKMEGAYEELADVESSLRNSEIRLRQTFESGIVGLSLVNFKGEVLEANNFSLKMFGISREELESKTWCIQDFVSFDSKEELIGIIRQVEVGAFVEPFEKEFVQKDGTLIPALIGLKKIDASSLVVSTIDLTEQKRSQLALSEMNSRLEERVLLRTQQLTKANRKLSRLVLEGDKAAEEVRQSQSFLDSVIENIPNMIFVKNAESLQFIRFNRAGEDLIGASREMLLGKTDYDFFPEEQADFFVAKDRATIASRTILDIPEEPIVTPQGIRFLHTKKIPIFDKEGKPQYLLGISEDITERKAAEKQKMELMQAHAARSEAEKATARLTFLSEASSTLSESLDLHSMMNSLSRVVTGHMCSHFIIDLLQEKEGNVQRVINQGRFGSDAPFRDLPLDFALSEKKGIAEVLTTGTSLLFTELPNHILENIFFDKAAAEKVIQQKIRSAIIVPLSYHGSVFGTMTLIARDSFHVYNELDLSIAKDLAKRSSLAIQNAQLYGKANDASRAKSAFLANISHEIRTPLGAMLGFAELSLDSGSLSPDIAQYMETIIRNGSQLLRIVDDVLDISKVESDRIHLERINFSLPGLMDEVVSLLQIKAKEKGLRFNIYKPHGLPEKITTDPLRLRQILINMIGNSIKFTKTGSVALTVDFKPDPQNIERGVLEFVVSDTGIGMSEVQAQKLFEPFTQADDSMTRKFGGTGLGLFLSRKLARLLGGDVELVSHAPNKGCQFKITLNVEVPDPLQVDNFPTTTLEEPLASGLLPEACPHIKVLIVDDSPDNQFLVRAFLSKIRVEADIASNGRQGVEWALRGSYAIIFMDIQMPEMDGFEAVKCLRTGGYKGVVVALTAHAMKGDKEKGLDAGFDDYLCKPITRESLAKCVNRFIKTPMNRQHSPPTASPADLLH